MNNIPLFDSLPHPTINGEWRNTGNKENASIELLLAQMKESNTNWGFAVGMQGIGNYSEEKFSKWVLSYTDRLFPVAYIGLEDISDDIKKNIKKFNELKKQGYVGIKLHPRLSKFCLDDKRLVPAIRAAHESGLITLLCTYFYDSLAYAYKNSIETLVQLLSNFTEEKIILVHAGAVRLLELTEVSRAFKNVLLDLSLTFIKYEGSSIDMDIKFLFNSFDRRICVGSDFPEFSLIKMRERFDFFAKDVLQEKLENIAYKNIVNFTGININK